MRVMQLVATINPERGGDFMKFFWISIGGFFVDRDLAFLARLRISSRARDHLPPVVRLHVIRVHEFIVACEVLDIPRKSTL